MRLKNKATVARRIRRVHSPEFKARIALEALRETQTMEPLDQPPQDLAAARAAANLPADDFFLLAAGETRKLPVRVGK